MKVKPGYDGRGGGWGVRGRGARGFEETRTILSGRKTTTTKVPPSPVGTKGRVGVSGLEGGLKLCSAPPASRLAYFPAAASTSSGLNSDTLPPKTL